MTPLVLVHGFTGSPASFDELLAQLLQRGQRPRIYRPRLLGHGQRPCSGPRRFEQEVDRLAGEIQRAGCSGAHLCGYSLGARVSLGLLGRHARLFSGATLIGVHPGLSSHEARAARVGSDERWCELLLRRGTIAFLSAWEAQDLFSSQRSLPERRLEQQREVRRGHTAGGLCQALRVLGLGQMPDYRGVLCGSALRVRLIVGAKDEKFLALARQLAAAGEAAVRHAVELTAVPGAGHNVLLEAPEQLAGVLTKALEVPA